MKKIIKIAIIDFDGTLVSSPLPETGKRIYKEKTGKDFPHKGWWSKRESLDTEIFDIPLINSVKEAYDELSLEEGTFKVMLTGRIKPLAKQVESILDSHDVKFDEYHYNSGGPTEVFKMRVMDELLDKFPKATEFIIFEDRVEHVEIFHEFLMKKIDGGRLKKYEIVVVPSDNHK